MPNVLENAASIQHVSINKLSDYDLTIACRAFFEGVLTPVSTTTALSGGLISPLAPFFLALRSWSRSWRRSAQGRLRGEAWCGAATLTTLSSRREPSTAQTASDTFAPQLLQQGYPA